MGCGKKDDIFENHNGCVCEVVRAIKDIQDATDDNCECPGNCFSEPLGALVSPARTNVNTRVFALLTAKGKPFRALFRDQAIVDGAPTLICGESIFFRVEEIFDNCCATLRVLRIDGLDCETSEVANFCQLLCTPDLQFFATNDCVTVDLNCFCAIQCLADVFVDLCD